MNIEFLIHGTLSDGQSSWKETDQDYCARSYVANRQENVVLDIEVQKSGNGLSAYYNYLRYKNISAPRRTLTVLKQKRMIYLLFRINL